MVNESGARAIAHTADPYTLRIAGNVAAIEGTAEFVKPMAIVITGSIAGRRWATDDSGYRGSITGPAADACPDW
jgi:hypothetical protein